MVWETMANQVTISYVSTEEKREEKHMFTPRTPKANWVRRKKEKKKARVTGMQHENNISKWDHSTECFTTVEYYW